LGPFCLPAAGQQGDFGRNVLRGFGASQADLAFQREFHFTEKVQVRFRGEFFNIFNHTQFELPQGDIINSSFGFVTSARDPRIGQLAMKFLF
jgi:hypothetical protein